MLQAWASEIEVVNEIHVSQGDFENLEAIVALDLTNAYGLFYRSHAIDEVRENFPRLA